MTTAFEAIVPCITTGATSPIVSTVTLEGRPRNVSAILTDGSSTALGATFVNASWMAPGMPNGDVTGYTLTYALVTAGSTPSNVTIVTSYDNITVLGNITHVMVRSMMPYTTYAFTMTACTRVGCSSSETVVVVTEEAHVGGFDPPTLTPLVGGTTLRVMWHIPVMPNGVIVGYAVEYQRVRDATTSSTSILTTSAINTTVASTTPSSGPTTTTPTDAFRLQRMATALATDVVLENLTANAIYTVRAIAINGAGDSGTTWVNTRTLESIPDDVGPPDFVRSVSESVVEMNVSAPALPNGLILGYSLIVRYIYRGHESPMHTCPTDKKGRGQVCFSLRLFIGQ